MIEIKCCKADQQIIQQHIKTQRTVYIFHRLSLLCIPLQSLLLLSPQKWLPLSMQTVCSICCHFRHSRQAPDKALILLTACKSRAALPAETVENGVEAHDLYHFIRKMHVSQSCTEGSKGDTCGIFSTDCRYSLSESAGLFTCTTHGFCNRTHCSR